MNRLSSTLLILTFLITSCGGKVSHPPQPTLAPVSSNIPSPLPLTSTPTIPPSQLAIFTPSVTPLPTFTPNPLIHPDPFPTNTANPFAQSIVQKRGVPPAIVSPDGVWATISQPYPGGMDIIQVHGDKRYNIGCEVFLRCELILPIQWSPDGSMVYVAPFITGESSVHFRLYTGVARFDVRNGKLEKLASDLASDIEYSISLSPDRKLLAFTDTNDSTPSLTIIDTVTLKQVVTQTIKEGVHAGEILWTTPLEIVFVSAINCESYVYSFNVETNMLSLLIDKDPTCISLLFINEQKQVALSKTTYYPVFTKSYWYFDLNTREQIPVSSPP